MHSHLTKYPYAHEPRPVMCCGYKPPTSVLCVKCFWTGDLHPVGPRWLMGSPSWPRYASNLFQTLNHMTSFTSFLKVLKNSRKPCKLLPLNGRENIHYVTLSCICRAIKKEKSLDILKDTNNAQTIHLIYICNGHFQEMSKDDSYC